MDSLEKRIDALRAIGPFAELSTERLSPVAAAAEVACFRGGDVIVQQGGPGDAVYALMQGSVEVWVEEPPERHVLLRTMRSGQLFGETAVLYRGPRSATIKARTEVTTLRIPGPVFLRALEASPELAVRIAVILAQRLASDRHTLISDPTTGAA